MADDVVRERVVAAVEEAMRRLLAHSVADDDAGWREDAEQVADAAIRAIREGG